LTFICDYVKLRPTKKEDPMKPTLEQMLREEIRPRIEAGVRGCLTRPTKRNIIAFSKEELKERAEFIEKWQKMNEQGEKSRFLTWSDGYEGSELVPNTAMSYDMGTSYVHSDEEWERIIAEKTEQRLDVEIGRLKKALAG
jgi:hypothetical protein